MRNSNVRFPVKRLQKTAISFNATYDSDFGICLFGSTPNVRNIASDPKGLKVGAYRRHGFTNAKFDLVAAPFSLFKSAIMDAERDNDLPCPILEGHWARDSAAVLRSYLFVTDASEANIDKIILYSKLAKFGAILFHKESVFANHGHFEINKRTFPDGISSLKRAVKKLHHAGLHAGVHVYGPSISPNDPFVTPKPDSRLASIQYPPLALPIGERDDTIILSEPPPITQSYTETVAFPNRYLQIDDEIIQYDKSDIGPPLRFRGCKRGALGTTAVPHIKGDKVKRLLALYGYFLVEPDSTLADEITHNFANVVNECDIDFVYFDASDGIGNDVIDGWYYPNKLHLASYRKFKKDILYQTSSGTGSDLTWHITPRSASADGHGDIKGYLDQRWPAIRGMETQFIKPDIGWYYWFKDPDVGKIEYVCAKTLGINGSLSIETSLGALEQIPQSRQLFEIIGRYEECRKSQCLSDILKVKLLEQMKDYKLLRDTEGSWHLYHAIYEEARQVNMLDGHQNVWSLYNQLPQPCLLGFEIAARPSGAKTGASVKGRPTLNINGETIELPVDLKPGQVLTNEGVGGFMLWEGTMKQGKLLRMRDGVPFLKPGENRIVFSWSNPDFPGGIQLILYGLQPVSN